jgi:hypothetical protein
MVEGEIRFSVLVHCIRSLQTILFRYKGEIDFIASRQVRHHTRSKTE